MLCLIAMGSYAVGERREEQGVVTQYRYQLLFCGFAYGKVKRQRCGLAVLGFLGVKRYISKELKLRTRLKEFRVLTKKPMDCVAVKKEIESLCRM